MGRDDMSAIGSKTAYEHKGGEDGGADEEVEDFFVNVKNPVCEKDDKKTIRRGKEHRLDRELNPLGDAGAKEAGSGKVDDGNDIYFFIKRWK